MSVMPKRACRYPKCPALITSGRYCEKHQERFDKYRNQRIDSQRMASSQRGYDSRWRKYRTLYLKAHPLCVACEARGRTRAAEVVDHIIPHQGDEALFWEPSNHQALCRWHHNKKTAGEDGGFGNRKKKP